MMAVRSGMSAPIVCAIVAAIGTRATIVPTLVPIEREIKQAAINNPGNNMLEGRKRRAQLTVASTLPISFAEAAKAPASTYIHNMSIRLSELAPRLNKLIRLAKGKPPHVAMAYILDAMKATVTGTL